MRRFQEQSPAGARYAAGVFALYVVAAFPLILVGLGSYHWFFRDEWAFLAGRDAGSLDDVFRPHAEHWTTFGVLVFRGLYAIVGLHSYVPYQAMSILGHLGVVVLIRVVMRRAGVGPWVATAAAGSFVLFGPGSQNILSAFQIAFTGALGFGLAHLLLADHDGPVDRRDGFGLVCGLLAIMSSGLGVVMVVVVGAVVVLRRGLMPALLHTVPLAAAYGVWWLIHRPPASSDLGRPSLTTSLEWVISGQIGAFRALGHYSLVAAALAVMTAVGVVLAVMDRREEGLRGRLLIPMALFAGGVLFHAIVAEGRWWAGTEIARSNRYVHVTVALTLPLVAVAIEALAARRRELVVPAVALVLVAVPVNASDFVNEPFDEDWHRDQELAVRAAPSLSFLRDVAPDTPLFAGASVSPHLTVGYVLAAREAGDLPELDQPVPAFIEDKIRVNVGVTRMPASEIEGTCTEFDGPVDLTPSVGTKYTLLSSARLSVLRDGEASAGVFHPSNPFFPVALSVQLPDLELRMEPAGGSRILHLCVPQ